MKRALCSPYTAWKCGGGLLVAAFVQTDADQVQAGGGAADAGAGIGLAHREHGRILECVDVVDQDAVDHQRLSVGDYLGIVDDPGTAVEIGDPALIDGQRRCWVLSSPSTVAQRAILRGAKS